jgi:hypothetical protein
MNELSAFKRINLLKYCNIGSRMTHFGLPRVKRDRCTWLILFTQLYHNAWSREYKKISKNDHES